MSSGLLACSDWLLTENSHDLCTLSRLYSTDKCLSNSLKKFWRYRDQEQRRLSRQKLNKCVWWLPMSISCRFSKIACSQTEECHRMCFKQVLCKLDCSRTLVIWVLQLCSYPNQTNGCIDWTVAGEVYGSSWKKLENPLLNHVLGQACPTVIPSEVQLSVIHNSLW